MVSFYWVMQGYFDSLRLEIHKRNINVLVVCPGPVKANIAANAFTESLSVVSQGEVKSICNCNKISLSTMINRTSLCSSTMVRLQISFISFKKQLAKEEEPSYKKK